MFWWLDSSKELGGLDSELSSEELGGFESELSSEGSDVEDRELSSDTESESIGVPAEMPPHVSTPLFPESHISAVDFNIALMSVVQRHNLTYSSQTDILKLMSMVLPTPNAVPSSSNMLRSKFTNLTSETVVQHFCGSCSSQHLDLPVQDHFVTEPMSSMQCLSGSHSQHNFNSVFRVCV